jgi:hypothetical protein
MPAYAKTIYEYFNAKNVLDPCMGWGDRLLGAAASGVVKRYVGFDPNKSLRPGYAQVLKLFGHGISHMSDDRLSIQFDNNFSINSMPFEQGAPTVLADAENSFDLVFTSPPFFDYEMYSKENPQYVDWLTEFYRPLMIESCRCVKQGHYVCIHIDDTSAGNIVGFLKEQVHTFCGLRLQYQIGLKGVMSGEIRKVWVFQKV